ncbi:MAG: HAD-IIIA family hydrolase [Candidatus Bipolaricaulota bacterium]
MKLLQADATADSISDVNYGGLWLEGVRGMVFDLDNTLCRWREDGLDEDVVALLGELVGRGFKLAVLSNGRLSRRRQLLQQLRDLKVPVIWPARKPCPWGFSRALSAIELRPSEAAMVGDQVFTDVLGARLAGLRVVRVRPISPWEHPATRVLRWLERLLSGK